MISVGRVHLQNFHSFVIVITIIQQNFTEQQRIFKNIWNENKKSIFYRNVGKNNGNISQKICRQFQQALFLDYSRWPNKNACRNCLENFLEMFEKCFCYSYVFWNPQLCVKILLYNCNDSGKEKNIFLYTQPADIIYLVRMVFHNNRRVSEGPKLFFTCLKLFKYISWPILPEFG